MQYFNTAVIGGNKHEKNYKYWSRRDKIAIIADEMTVYLDKIN